MILEPDSFRRPVRPAFFLGQLATQWVADWLKQHPQSEPRPVTVEVAQSSMTASAVIPAMVTVKETPVTVKAKSVEKTPRPVPNIPMQLPALVTSRKMGAGRYYLLNANPVEAWSRDKWWTGTQAGRDGRTYGRKPRTDHRIVTVCDFASSVSTRELRKAFAPLAACYA